MDNKIEMIVRLFKKGQGPPLPEGNQAKDNIPLVGRATQEQIKDFSSLIGKSVTDEITRRGLELMFYSLDGNDKHFAVAYKGKVLIFYPIHNGIYYGERVDMIISFMNEKDLPKLVDQQQLIGKEYDEIEPVLGKGTLDFLRFSADLLLKSDENCQIFLRPTSKRRERIYRKYFDKHPKSNIIVGDTNAGEDDTKNNDVG